MYIFVCMALFKALCWALIFIIRLRFPPGKSLVNIVSFWKTSNPTRPLDSCNFDLSGKLTRACFFFKLHSKPHYCIINTNKKCHSFSFSLNVIKRWLLSARNSSTLLNHAFMTWIIIQVINSWRKRTRYLYVIFFWGGGALFCPPPCILFNE